MLPALSVNGQARAALRALRDASGHAPTRTERPRALHNRKPSGHGNRRAAAGVW
jgi:hypothetical protein